MPKANFAFSLAETKRRSQLGLRRSEMCVIADVGWVEARVLSISPGPDEDAVNAVFLDEDLLVNSASAPQRLARPQSLRARLSEARFAIHRASVESFTTTGPWRQAGQRVV